jgi:hypothetical protein
MKQAEAGMKQAGSRQESITFDVMNNEKLLNLVDI